MVKLLEELSAKAQEALFRFRCKWFKGEIMGKIDSIRLA